MQNMLQFANGSIVISTVVTITILPCNPVRKLRREILSQVIDAEMGLETHQRNDWMPVGATHCHLPAEQVYAEIWKGEYAFIGWPDSVRSGMLAHTIAGLLDSAPVPACMVVVTSTITTLSLQLEVSPVETNVDVAYTG